MATYRKFSKVVDAVQFDPSQDVWPPGVMRWPDAHGVQPRDGSWGYIQTSEGRKNIQASDWILTGEGKTLLMKDSDFQKAYEPLQEKRNA